MHVGLCCGRFLKPGMTCFEIGFDSEAAVRNW